MTSIENLAANLVVLRTAEQVASKRGHEQVFGYFTGQRDAYGTVLKDMRGSGDSRNVEEHADHVLTALKPQYVTAALEAAIRRTGCSEYVKFSRGTVVGVWA
jgi:hypothetical protein